MKENLGSKLLDVGFADDFLNLTPKGKSTKAKLNSWDYIKLKSISTAKATISKMKGQATEWKKYLQIIYLIGS